MKIRVFITTSLLFFGSILSVNAWAVDLIDVYKQAYANDPTFKAARSKWLAESETLAIKKASLFPQLGASGSYIRSYNQTKVPVLSNGYGGNTKFFANTASYSLTLTQSLFDFGSWASVWQAQAIKKRAEVEFLAAAESLLLRTAKAYFNVLEAKDNLSYARAYREAIENTLNQTQHKYAVGLVAIVDLEDARASYDNARAKEIAAINDLDDKKEQLAEITGVRYLALDPVKEGFPLLSPQPTDIDRWVKAAEQQNYELAGAKYASIAAREEVKIKNAGHLPTISATGSYQYAHKDNSVYMGTVIDSEVDRTATGGVTFNLPLFQGGGVLAQARQASYLYQAALAEQEKKYRSVVSSTRQNYLGVISNISQIRANAQAVRSSQSSLRATKAGYEVGTRTMVDVLKAQSTVYENQRNFATSEYAYINQLLTLKKDTGILDEDDLMQINAWLTKAIKKSTASNEISDSDNNDVDNKKPSKDENKDKAKSKNKDQNNEDKKVAPLKPKEVQKKDLPKKTKVKKAKQTTEVKEINTIKENKDKVISDTKSTNENSIQEGPVVPAPVAQANAVPVEDFINAMAAN